MRLRLNTTLRAALIAAITAVGFTLTQAQATELTKVADMTTLVSNATTITASESGDWTTTVAGGAVYTFDGSSGYIGGISYTELNNALTFANADYVTLAAWINVPSHGTSDSGRSIFGYGGQNDGYKIIDQGGSLKLTTKYVKDFDTSAAGIGTNEWDLVAVTIHKDGNNFQVRYTINGTTSATDVTGGAAKTATEAFAIGSGNGSSKRELFNGSIANFTVYSSTGWVTANEISSALGEKPSELVPTTLIWGAGDSNLWNTAADNLNWYNWDTGGLSAYISAPATVATFGDSGTKEVTVSGAIKAKTVDVQADYAFTVSSGSSLTAESLTVANGKKATFAGTGAITFKTISGAVVINEDATVSLTSGIALDSTHALNVTGAGTLNVPNFTIDGGTLEVTTNLNITGTDKNTITTSQNGNASKILIKDGTTTMTGGIHMKGGNGSTIEIGTDTTNATLITNRLEMGDNGGGTSYLTIKKDSALIITGTNDAHAAEGDYKNTGLLLSEWGQQTHTSVAGKLYAKNVNLRQGNQPLNITIADGGEVAVKGINKGAPGRNAYSVITMNGGKLILGADGMINDGGDWNITLNGGEIGMSADATTLARAMNVAGNVTFNTAQYTWSDDGHSISAGSAEGTMTVSGSLTGTGTITKTGAGTLVLSGTANAISNTIALQAGTLTLSGAFVLDAMQVQGEQTEYIGGTGIAQGSGFKKTAGTLDVVNVGTDTTLTIAQDASFTYQNEAVTVNASTGDVTLAGTTDYTSLWINSATTVGYTDAQAIASVQGQTIGTVHMNADGSTITMDKEGASIALVLKSDASATVNATAATTISSITGPVAGKTLTIGGNSVVTFQNSSDFAGNVAVTGGTVKLGHQTALGAHNSEAGSTKTITVGAGATIDVNGKGDAKYVYTLNGGTLTNMGGDIGHNMAQTSGLILTDDSYIGSDGSNEMWVLAGSYEVNTVNLNNHKLTKKGDSTFGFSNSNISAGTLQVDGGTLKIQDDNNKHGSIAANVVLNGGNITGSLNLAGDITVTAMENVSTDATFSIGTGKTLKLATDEGKQLTLSNGLSVAAGTAEIAGTVNVNSKSLDLSSGGNSTGKVKVDDGGTLNVNSNMWMGKNSSGVELAEGGILNLANLNIVGKTGGGSVTTTADNDLYNTENAAFAINKATVTATGDVIIGNTLSGVDVATGENAVTLNSSADSVTVNGRGTFTKGDSAAVGTITVEDGGTIAGGVNATDVTIKAGATGTFDEGIADEEAMIYIGNAIEGSPTITNKGETEAKYAGLQDESMSVTADFLESYASGDSPVVVNNELVVKSIAHDGTGELTLAHVNADALKGVYAYDGALSLQNITKVSLTEMTIAPEATVAVYQGDAAAAEQEGTVTITDTLTAGGGTLLANLTIEASEGDAFQWDLGGTTMTLGSKLTLVTTDGLIQLDDATMQNIADMQVGDFYELVLEKQGSSLNYEGGDWWDEVFTRSYGGENALALVGDYRVGMLDNGNFGVTKSSNVPEPTTGTLSLLALAALAARRRRK